MIIIKNVILNKKVKAVIKFELVFYKDHNLLIYFKLMMIKQQFKKIIEKNIKSNSIENEFSEDKLSDIDDKQNFQ